MNFKNYTYSCNHHLKENIEHFHHPRNFPFTLSKSFPPSDFSFWYRVVFIWMYHNLSTLLLMNMWIISLIFWLLWITLGNIFSSPTVDVCFHFSRETTWEWIAGFCVKYISSFMKSCADTPMDCVSTSPYQLF